jgi:hypothetical protein
MTPEFEKYALTTENSDMLTGQGKAIATYAKQEGKKENA